MYKEAYLILVEKIANGTATAAEIAQYQASFDAFQEAELDWAMEGLDPVALEQESLRRFHQQYLQKPRRHFALWSGIAASLLLMLGSLFLFQPATPDILIEAGGNKAVLIDGSGKSINLSHTKNGLIIKDGKFNYDDGSEVGQQEQIPKEFTLSTPRGGQYQVTLPDGTRVWLNAASSLKFPTAFAGLKSREVDLTGEAYFEVTKDPEKPFIVKTAAQQVRVLGTHFNIQAYAGEREEKTTLLEGSVRVDIVNDNAKSSTLVLKPGQQSILRGQQLQVIKVDPSMAVDWKNAFFVFDHDQLEDILKKVARWYDVEIIYLDQRVKKEIFSGRISRSEKVTEVLKKLSLTGAVKFEIEGRRVSVKK
jgi:transmembrane sensor